MRWLTTVSGLVIIIALSGLIYLGQQRGTTERTVVGVTINPIFDLVKQIAGDDVPVELIAPAGSNAHDYEFKPRDAQVVDKSRVIFSVGHGFDDWIATNAGQAPVTTLDQGIEFLPSGDDQDPHYFLSPANAILITQQIAEELTTYWPEYKDSFSGRAAAYQAQLEQLIANYTPRFKEKPTTIATFHNAFAYLARDFGITVATTFEEFPGESPTPAWVADFQKQVQDRQIKVIYAEPGFPRSTIESIADDLGLTIAELDPLESNLRHQDYLSAIEDNLETLLSS